MKQALLLLIAICGFGFLNGCGGGGSTGGGGSILATHFSVTPSTSTPAGGTVFSITVTALGASGQTATSYSGTLHFTSTDGRATLPPDTAMASVTGIFSITLNTGGPQTITVTDTNSLQGSGAITVGASAATHFSVVAASYSASIGTPINIVVNAIDANGNTAPLYSGIVHFTSNDGKAVLPANSPLTNGVGNFSVTLNTSGGGTITVTDTVSTAITGMSNTFSVSGPATHFSVANVAASAATRSPVTLAVIALDASNNASTGYTGTVHITSSDQNAILPANAPLNSGLGNFQITLETAGAQTVTATDAVTASITGTGSITVNATAPLAITSGAPPPGTVGSAYGPTTTQFLKCSFAGIPVHFGCTPCVPNIAGCGGSYPNCFSRHPPGTICIEMQTFVGFELTATGGVNPYAWTSSTLPPGLVIKTQNGTALISGTPTPGTAATYTPMVTLNDAGLPATPMTATYSVAISNPPPPVVNTSPLLLPGATVGQPFSFTFTATAGLPPYQNWKESGTLPGGINPLTTGGVLSGAPTVTGSFPISVTVEDSLGQVSAAQAFNFQVYPHGFKATGPMGTARTSHTATLLTDGTVLVAGGVRFSSAEKYDPSSGRFAATAGSMSVTRYSHTATLLAGGKVLITGGGGLNGDPVLATAELFDPSTGMFTLTGSMSVARTGHNATVLSDGRVLITGGGTTTADLFDPSTGKFTPTTGKLLTARVNDTATLLANGKVLITGGFNTAGLATAELYDPATESFSATGSMGAARLAPTATLLNTGANTGKVLVAGGTSTTSVAELYDPATGTFSSTGSLAAARAGHTATLLGDLTVLMVGGNDFSGNILAASELFNATSGTFAGTGGLQAAREAHTATLLKDGTVLVTGGIGQGSVILTTAEVYQ